MRRFAVELTRSPLGLAGVALATIAGVLLVTLLALSFAGFQGGPYLGILAFLVLPALFVIGLVLMPVGAARLRRRERASGGPGAQAFPVLDLNDARIRRRLVVVLALSAVNVVVVATATYKAVEVMDSPAFCGSCHPVMDPELAAYRRSPHARVPCVECHIGPGASWFVKSKLSGTWQLFATALDLYPRPIPVPVHDLRPARDTCERCHWPARFVGDRLAIRVHHADDAASTPLRTVLLLHVGGGPEQRGEGIHRHVLPGVQIRYVADPTRTRIGTVELTRPDGSRRTYRTEGGPSPGDEGAAWRTMDCVDCHNRPTHRFRTPEEEIDDAIETGRIDRALPFVRRRGLRLLRANYPSAAAARAAIRDGLVSVYRERDPAAFAAREPAVERAATALGDAWAENVFPGMAVTWGTYPSFIGHEAAPGCFRCHDDRHRAEDGAVLSQDCDQCHALLAQGEEHPKILDALRP